MLVLDSLIYNLNMEKSISKNKQILILATAVAAGTGVAVVASQASSFIERGLSDSQKIRVAERNDCATASSSSDEARFVGCNSIL